MRQTNFAAAIIAVMVASVKACDPNALPDQSNIDLVELQSQNYMYIKECQADGSGITFSQFYRRYGDFFPEAQLSYDDYIADFLNSDLDGDGRLSKLELLNRALALKNLETLNYLGDLEAPYSDISLTLFEMMDQKYTDVEGAGIQLVSDGKVCRQSFKAYAPELLKVDVATEQLVTREMRHRDYDYMYSSDPKAVFAAFDYEEMLFYIAFYEEMKPIYDELVNVVGSSELGVSKEQFRNQANPWIRADPEFSDPNITIPDSEFEREFNQVDGNSNGYITFDEMMYPQIEDDIQYQHFFALFSSIETNDDNILTYDEVYSSFARQRGVDSEEATQMTQAFMAEYSNDGETVPKQMLWNKMHQKFDQELRNARVQERLEQEARDKKYDWWEGWYKIDTDKDDIVTYDQLVLLFGNEEDAQAALNLFGTEGTNYITRDDTQRWAHEVEAPARAISDKLKIAADVDYDGLISLEDWRNEQVKSILGVDTLEEAAMLFNDYDSNQSGVVSAREICDFLLPGATWNCKNEIGEDDGPIVEPPVEPPVDPPVNPPVDFEELWAILSGVSDGKVSLEDYKKVAHLVWPEASDVEIELHFSTHDLNDDGVVEEHEAKQVVVHTPLLQDAVFIAREIWDRIDSNDNGMIDFDEVVDIYNLFYTLDFIEDDLNIEELSIGYGMLVAMIGEPNKDNILRIIQDEMKKAAHQATEARR